MSASSTNDVVAVYASLDAAKAASPDTTLEPLPSYALYKTGREVELAAYRGLCRALALHTEGAPSKVHQRLLEDLREQLFLSDERGDLEWQAAQSDEVLTAVRRSGVLANRADFFDGTDDVPLAEAIRRARDDGSAVFCPQAKVARTEQNGSAGAGVAAAALSTPAVNTFAPSRPPHKKTPHTAVMSTVAKLRKEIIAAGADLIVSTNPTIQQEKEALIREKRAQLVSLKQQLEAERA